MGLIFKSFSGCRSWIPLIVIIVIISLITVAIVSECFPLPDVNENTDLDGDVIMEDVFDNVEGSKPKLDLNLAL